MVAGASYLDRLDTCNVAFGSGSIHHSTRRSLLDQSDNLIVCATQQNATRKRGGWSSSDHRFLFYVKSNNGVFGGSIGALYWMLACGCENQMDTPRLCVDPVFVCYSTIDDVRDEWREAKLGV
jgi:hypothetical protein